MYLLFKIDVIEKQIRAEINKNNIIYKNKLITIFEESKIFLKKNFRLNLDFLFFQIFYFF